jgi:hypothetical protein
MSRAPPPSVDMSHKVRLWEQQRGWRR